MLALDSGKGIADIGRSFEDGFSTAGTTGQGLGAMSRLATMLQIYSLPENGTAVFARLLKEGSAEASAASYEFGAVSLPITGEVVCGECRRRHKSNFSSLRQRLRFS
jgi:hypothetical protein